MWVPEIATPACDCEEVQIREKFKSLKFDVNLTNINNLKLKY